jgi:hypothetical protein
LHKCITSRHANYSVLSPSLYIKISPSERLKECSSLHIFPVYPYVDKQIVFTKWHRGLNPFRGSARLVSLMNLHLMHMERWLLVFTYCENVRLKLRRLVEMLHRLCAIFPASSLRKRARCSTKRIRPAPESKLSQPCVEKKRPQGAVYYNLTFCRVYDDCVGSDSLILGLRRMVAAGHYAVCRSCASTRHLRRKSWVHYPATLLQTIPKSILNIMALEMPKTVLAR